jgi:hypothetical protein
MVPASTGSHPQTAALVSARRSGPTGWYRDGAATADGGLLAPTRDGTTGTIGTSAAMRAPIITVDAKVRTPDMIRQAMGR